MRKAKSLLGLNVITQLEGKQLGSVRDLIFDENSHKLVAVLLTDRELFGAIDATVIPWPHVKEIGPHAIMVPSEAVVLKAHADPVIAESFDQKRKLDGKKVTTQGGEDLGRVSDVYIDNEGFVKGFEVSGGIFADAFSGKRYLEMPSEITVGDDVVLVPQALATELERQKREQPGGLVEATSGISAKVGEVYETAKAKATETYDNLATASVEKQREYVIGKVASRDVVIPADKVTPITAETLALDAPDPLDPLDIDQVSGLDITPTAIPEVHHVTHAETTDVTSTGEIVEGEVLVRAGEVITAAQADRAINTGQLAQLVAAAVGSAASKAYDSVKTTANSTVSTGKETATDTQSKLEAAALGKPSALEVIASDGTVIIAPGMIVTQAVLDQAATYGKKGEVVAAAGLGNVSQKTQDTYAATKDAAGNLWDNIKQKTAELTGSAQEKKAEYDAKAEQNKINKALGRPVTRVILAKDDSVILNTGDIITNKAIELARQNEALPILLDSVYETDPTITPEMLRVSASGQAALDSQIQPTGVPTPTSAVVVEDEQPTTTQVQPETAGAQHS